ncbi:hypothetical protein ES703_124983 [subsurface metagenome]
MLPVIFGADIQWDLIFFFYHEVSCNIFDSHVQLEGRIVSVLIKSEIDLAWFKSPVDIELSSIFEYFDLICAF